MSGGYQGNQGQQYGQQPQGYGAPNPMYAQQPQGYVQPGYQPYGQAYAPPPAGGFPTLDAYAGFWIRFVAYLVDALVLAIPSVVVSSVVFAAFGFAPDAAIDFAGRQTMAMNQQYQLANNVSSLVQLLLFWPYYAGMHAAKGATVGKLALGLRVVDSYGHFPSFARASGRYFSMILSACLCLIGYIWAGFHPQKRALHDLIAGTYVVRKEYARQS